MILPQTLTAGIAVFDREAGQFVHQQDADRQFRSASVVKLLIALDFFWDRGPEYDVPPADRERLDVMLRSSDDDAASYYWERLGGAAIVDRMVERLGLTHTAGPPASHPGFWGYVALTAADTVRIYRYVLEDAPLPVREYVMGQLHQATRHGTDGFDQYFGIASVFETGYSIKQGWSGFHGSSGYRSDKAKPQSVVDLVNDALHTTGTVGTDDRSIVAVFTLHPSGTPYEQAYAAVTRLIAGLTVPGGVRVLTAHK
ncbi:hypothetical protein [Kribbella sindirgiensis]|uniref:Serine hydrolase n=1 Tax=Kribbella sindirgiensis TaxID=1124744 RepID=A0A4R0IM73_9ACTN|nr:hypothetical protein [Kribbella sindirgiensis]TCC32318.1 hypothetical protein E0H50_19150 [Kribbella sindirgiensis]